MNKSAKVKTITKVAVIFAFSFFLIFAEGCDFISGMFSKKDENVEKAYMEYRNAMKSGDVETLKKLVAKDKVHELESEQASSMLDIARALYPPDVTVTGTSVEGNAATLTVSSAVEGGSMQGIVHLLKEDGEWKVYEEKWEMKMGMFSPQVQTSEKKEDTLPLSQEGGLSQPQPYNQGKESSGGATGEAVIVKDGVQETYILQTGFISETRFNNPKRAEIQFQMQAEEFGNARRIEITLDATKTGKHYADGKNYSVFDEDKVDIGSTTANGFTAIFKFIADGGQIFPPKDFCIINITSPYSGDTEGIFSGEISDCIIHSAGIDYNISSVKFKMKGVPSH
ncbi:MAG: hypothetical protein A2Y97_08075 [Nitrospirae bacterium RBG_13_39_12]|nr:MAG: hypothetical protein A2Y97_08075 [Nitrospirae bacterium RBG_13_39_12]